MSRRSVAAPSPWTVLIVTTAIQAMVSLMALAPPVFATEAAREMGLDARLIGFYTSMVYLGAMLTSLPAGSIVQRFGALRVSQVCLGLGFGGMALLSLGVPELVLVAALVVGFGYGPITPASSHVLARTTPPERRGLVFSLKQTGVPLGGFLAGAMVPTLVLQFGWQAAAVVVGVAAVALAIAAQPLRAALDAERNATAPLRGAGFMGPLRVVWGSRPLRLLSLASFTFAAIQLSLSSFLVAFLVQEAGLGLVAAGLILSAAQTGGVAGRVLWGVLADAWLGVRATLVGLAFVMAVCAGLMAWVAGGGWPVAAVVVLAVVFGATAIGWNGVFLAEVAHLAPAGQAGVATGGALFITYAGVVAGPALFGILVGLPGGYALAFSVMGAGSALGGLLVLAAHRGQ
jgi:MFS family permease